VKGEKQTVKSAKVVPTNKLIISSYSQL